MKTITFKEVCSEWLHRKEQYIRESTYSTYYSHLENHIYPSLGSTECGLLTEADLQNAVTGWAGELSEKSVKDIVMILKACIKYANKCGYINLKDMDIRYPSKKNYKKIKTYSAYEQRRIIRAVEADLNYKSLGILITLYTGIRIGELCALKWCDIDFKNNTVYITKTLQRLYFKDDNGNGYTKITITAPKTLSSIREIPLSSVIMNIIRKLRLKSGDAYVLTGNCKFIEPRTYRNYYNKFVEELGIRCLNFHSLRHTFATVCIESGADYKTVSELLGHSTVNMTLNLYVHPSMEQKRRCVEMIGNWI